MAKKKTTEVEELGEAAGTIRMRATKGTSAITLVLEHDADGAIARDLTITPDEEGFFDLDEELLASEATVLPRLLESGCERIFPVTD